jgi:Condensation domain
MNNELLERISHLSKEQQELFYLLMESQTNSIKPRNQKESIPATTQQKKLWEMYKIEPLSKTSNMSVALRLNGELQTDVLIEAIKYVVKRHDVLRVSFQETKAGIFQIVKDVNRFNVTSYDLTRQDNKEEYLLKHIEKEMKVPFILERDFLIRASILKKSDTESVLLLVFHHSIFDGWSGKIFFDELSHTYNCFKLKIEPDFETLRIQYSDFSFWEQDFINSDTYKKEYLLWKEAFEDNNFDYLIDHTPDTKEVDIRYKEIIIKKEITEKLKKLSIENEASLFMALFSLYSLSLSQHFQKENFIIGTPAAGRFKEEIETLIGMFVNTILLKVNVNKEDKFNDVLLKTKQVVTKGLDKPYYPIEEVISDLCPLDEKINRHPVFQTVFALQNAPSGNIDFEGLKVSIVKLENSSPLPQLLEFYSPVGAKLDISLVLGEKNGELVGILEYNQAILSNEEANSIVQRFYSNISEVI